MYDESTLHGVDETQLPPSNVQAEQALLGGLLTNNKAYDQISGFLRAEHFADPANGVIYAAVCRRLDVGMMADAVTLRAELESSDALIDVGGATYLAQLLTAMISPMFIADYAKAIHDAWMRRQLIDVGRQMIMRARSSSADMDGVAQLDIADRQLSEITVDNRSDDAPIMIYAAVTAAIEEGDNVRSGKGVTGISTGLPSLDRKILRLRAGNLLVMGGRPGIGKTALGRSIAVNVAAGMGFDGAGAVRDDADGGHAVAYFSLEEESVEYGAAVLAQIAGVSIGRVLDGEMSNDEARRVVTAQARLRETPLYIFRKPHQSMRGIASKARQLKRKLKGRRLGLVVVDYLQLMADPSGVREKRLAVGQNAYGLKELAKELGCAVLALSQLARGVEDREDKRPVMRDLRESGEIEDAADVVMFPYREEYYLRQARPAYDPDEPAAVHQQKLVEWQQNVDAVAGRAEILLPKVRRGEAPTHVDLWFDARRTRFEEVR